MALANTFRSLGVYNYRLWATGAFVSNIGTWMQRTAQDWIVLTELTQHNAAAVGITMALQFGPQVFLMTLTGWAADACDRRKLLIATQTAMGLLALILGVLILTKTVELWHVYALALMLGIVAAFDAPARQSFVSEVVDEANLSNAVALNSASFNSARMIGPAVAGVLINWTNSGWVFVINAVSFVAMIAVMASLRRGELHSPKRSKRTVNGVSEGFRYVRERPDLVSILLMLFIIGTFGLNFPIYISTMAVKIFHAGAGEYGLLTTFLAVGSVTGALLAAGRSEARVELLLLGAGLFGIGCGLAAIAPSYWIFAIILTGIGIAAQTFTTSTNAFVQVSTEPTMRGRVMAILMAMLMGGTFIGAPIVGWVADQCGPRAALGVGALAGIAAFAVGLRYLLVYRGLKVTFAGGKLQCVFAPNIAPIPKDGVDQTPVEEAAE
jgi:MFS family permease